MNSVVTSIRISREADAALDRLALAFDVPRQKVLDLAILRLQDEWQDGKVHGIQLSTGVSTTHAGEG
jgi:predicted transcriptional regulator